MQISDRSPAVRRHLTWACGHAVLDILVLAASTAVARNRRLRWWRESGRTANERVTISPPLPFEVRSNIVVDIDIEAHCVTRMRSRNSRRVRTIVMTGNSKAYWPSSALRCAIVSTGTPAMTGSFEVFQPAIFECRASKESPGRSQLRPRIHCRFEKRRRANTSRHR